MFYTNTKNRNIAATTNIATIVIIQALVGIFCTNLFNAFSGALNTGNESTNPSISANAIISIFHSGSGALSIKAKSPKYFAR